MRQSQKTNRPRNKNGRKPSGPSPNRVYESTGPEGKVRGTPQQIIEKYQSLARDKATAGDRVLSESFMQHAEHYMRILTAAQPAAPRYDERLDDRSEDRGDDRGEDRVETVIVAGEEPDAEEAPRGRHRGPGRGPRRETRDGRDGEAAGTPQNAVVDSLTVIDGDGDDDGGMVATPEVGGASDEAAPKRPARRAPRRASRADDAAQEGGSDVEDAVGETTRRPRRPRRRVSEAPELDLAAEAELGAGGDDETVRAAE